jgi:putative Holliday junction resolvase
MRILGIDVGGRRIGVAISDRSGTLARPLMTLAVAGGNGAADVAALVDRLVHEEDGLGKIVIGWPRRLDGSPSPSAPAVTAFAEGLRGRTPLPIAFEDERLTSVEAESRLAVREKDWRRRKAQLDAAAAAIILQDHIDRSSVERIDEDAPEEPSA